MATKKKLLQAAAGTAAAGGGGLNVEEVFSTYLYDGNSSTQTITNGIDLAGEGGLVWLKSRAASSDHELDDTVRGVGKRIASNQTYAEQSNSDVSAFNSNGFDLRYQSGLGNASGENYASWTFRKAPKFFDVVTYTGNGATHRDVPHNLGSTPGWVITKRLDAADNWMVYSKASAIEYKLHWLNTTDATVVSYNPSNSNYNWTDTVFYASSQYSFANTNASGASYVSYLFANHDGDGDFGPTGDQDIIKCGSYTGNGSSTGPEIDLGFEPQWLLVKRADAGADWLVWDAMRGAGSNNTVKLQVNTANTEDTLGEPIGFNATGFQPLGADSEINNGSGTYIYIAIRRGPMAVPESATDVFAIDTAGGTSPTPPTFVSGFPVDFSFYKNKTDSVNNWNSQNRLTGYGDLAFNTTSAEFSNNGSYWQKDYMNGIGSNTGTNSNGYQWMFRRAPNYFDVVAFELGNSSNREVKHNLNATPEMIWWKKRSGSSNWAVFHKDLGQSKYLLLQDTAAEATISNIWGTSSFSSSAFYLDETQFGVSGDDCIAYLFASLDGVSKVGTFTHTDGTPTDVDCGFTSGARFVLWKKASNVGQWAVTDTERGIVAGNDPYLELNSTNAENSSFDIIDPLSSGFTVAQIMSSGTYIFYAIA